MATARVGRLTTRCSTHMLQNVRGSLGMRAASHTCIVKADLTFLVLMQYSSMYCSFMNENVHLLIMFTYYSFCPSLTGQNRWS